MWVQGKARWDKIQTGYRVRQGKDIAVFRLKARQRLEPQAS